MRLPTLLIVLLASSAPLSAREPAQEVVLSNDGNLQKMSGVSVLGQPTVFIIKSPTDRRVTFTLEADNANCGAEMRTNLSNGFMPAFDRFPTSRSENARKGQTFTLSFFQTRTAWVSKAPCVFSWSIK